MEEVNREITREIEIDAGHRIPNHSSCCSNIHGHRYKIQATITGELCSTNGDSSEGMLLDFSFMKKVMIDFIHNFCDHSFIVWRKDPFISLIKVKPSIEIDEDSWGEFSSIVATHDIIGRILLVNFIPTAENLAGYWFHIMKEPIKVMSNHRAKLVKVRVYETPNCWADYSMETK
jgi:6-pyruvoyltetrahydropterin/6-carboxytetrahydropterin synthase